MKLSAITGWNLMASPPVAYVYGIRPDDGKLAPEDLSSGEVAAACMAHPEWETKSPVILRCLAFLDQFCPASNHPSPRVHAEPAHHG